MITKKCTICEKSLPLDCFYNSKNGKHGKDSRCKVCQKERTSEPWTNNYCKKRYHENGGFTEVRRDTWYRKQYGISLKEYKDLKNKQNNKCAICGDSNPHGRGRWHIDRCHTTGEVRGLLCHNCNTAVGLFKDDTNIINSAINYLKKGM